MSVASYDITIAIFGLLSLLCFVLIIVKKTQKSKDNNQIYWLSRIFLGLFTCFLVLLGGNQLFKTTNPLSLLLWSFTTITSLQIFWWNLTYNSKKDPFAPRFRFLAEGRIEELEALIKAGRSLIDINLEKAYLRGANLRGAYLRGANLRGADLRGANFDDANLDDANLDDANLRGANLRGADLRGADLRGANFDDANLRGADLRGANLYGANLYDANLYDANLYGSNLYGAGLYGADLYGADLSFVRGLTPSQVKKAKNWQKAKYDPEFRQELGLLEGKQ